MASPNQSIEGIDEVYFHPIALLQCMEYLKELPKIKIIEYKDNAEAAKRIKDGNIKNIVAIVSVADLFGVEYNY